jgi:hypothetical protein
MDTKIIVAAINKGIAYIGNKLELLSIALQKPSKVSVEVDLGDAAKTFEKAAKTLDNILAKTGAGGDDEADGATIRTEDHILLVLQTLKQSGKTLQSIAEKKQFEIPAELTRTLASINTALSNFKSDGGHSQLVVLSKIQALAERISSELQKDKFTQILALLGQIAAKNVKLEFPKTIKIDEMQMRLLGSNRGGGSVSVLGGGGLNGPSTNGVVYDGRKVVAVLNTPIALSSTEKLCEEVFITALTTNVQVVVVGGPGVVYTEATRTGRAMNPGDSIVLKIHDLRKVFINGEASDGVSFTYTA